MNTIFRPWSDSVPQRRRFYNLRGRGRKELEQDQGRHHNYRPATTASKKPTATVMFPSSVTSEASSPPADLQGPNGGAFVNSVILQWRRASVDHFWDNGGLRLPVLGSWSTMTRPRPAHAKRYQITIYDSVQLCAGGRQQEHRTTLSSRISSK